MGPARPTLGYTTAIIKFWSRSAGPRPETKTCKGDKNLVLINCNMLCFLCHKEKRTSSFLLVTTAVLSCKHQLIVNNCL